MRNLMALTLLLASGLLASGTAASAACDGATGPAKAAVESLIVATGGSELQTCVFYGDYTGDGKDDALVFLYYQSPDGGNSASLDIRKLRNTGGTYKEDGIVDDVFGENPRDAKFSKGKITIVTTMPKPGEPRCCPTGRERWTIKAR